MRNLSQSTSSQIDNIGTRNPSKDSVLIPSELPHTHITPSKGKIIPGLIELWKYRELLYFLIWRDIKIRYKQTIMGASWAIIQPLFTMVVFSLFFGRLAKVPSDNLPYPIFSYSALVPWTFFSNGVTLAANSLIVGANMVKKIYFPRITLPMASVLAGLLDFFLAMLVLIGMMLYFKIIPTFNMVWIPLLLLLALISSLGVSFWLAALNAQFRDVRYIVAFLLQAWMFATPIAYPSSLLSEPWRTIYGINPMVGVVEGFRWALLGTDTAPGPIIIISSIFAILILVSGFAYFHSMEETFADVL